MRFNMEAGPALGKNLAELYYVNMRKDAEEIYIGYIDLTQS